MKACWNACIAEGSFLRLTKNLAIFFQHFKFPCFSESNFYRLQSVSIAFHLCKESKILSQSAYFHFCFFTPATSIGKALRSNVSAHYYSSGASLGHTRHRRFLENDATTRSVVWGKSRSSVRLTFFPITCTFG